MEATILNTNFEDVCIIDNYKSFIWTDRYDEAGDFEICIPISKLPPTDIKKGYYVWNANSEHMMIIDTITIDSDVEDGALFIISGKSLESILSRRIVWRKKVFVSPEVVDPSTGAISLGDKPNLQNGIKTLLEENVINTVEARKIPNFIFDEELEDEKITSLTFEAEYLGNELYEVIHNLCVENEIGFKVTYHDTFVKDGVTYNNAFVFKLYAGVDHSYGTEEEPQIMNPYVIFSPNYENITNTNYLDSDSALKNVTLIVGESEYDEDGNEVTRIDYELGSATGLERREIYTDSTSLAIEDEHGGIISSERYQALLKQKGIDTLMENTTVTAFDGEVDPTNMYVYGEHYYMGDIVQIANEYGQEGRAYISEYIMSCDDGGMSTYPTFKAIQKGVYET